jgi:cobalt-zinc-cadmium efflux system membrane fusion protein
MKNRIRLFALTATMCLAGCGRTPVDPPAAMIGASQASGHSHEGWWCDEHGVPEQVCALCNSKLAADFKSKGNWCKEHDRPDSQCFACHPEFETAFAAQYEAKYGKQPPKLR